MGVASLAMPAACTARFMGGKHHRQTGRPLGPHPLIQPGQILGRHLPVQAQPRRKRLILGRSRHLPLHRQMRQKHHNLWVEIGTDMTAFGTPDRLASWVGICPGNNESAGKRKSGHIRKGNLYVRRLLCEFAHAASRTPSVFKSKFQALVIRRGHKRAIIAIGHKILRNIFFMLKRREHYRDSAIDYVPRKGVRVI